MNFAFLFGAGAETLFNICSGSDFAKHVLGIEKSKAIQKIIQAHYKNILDNCKNSSEHPDWYPTTYYAPNFNIDSLLRNSIKKEWQLTNKQSSSIKLFKKEVSSEAKKITSTKEKRKRIYANPNYMGILDENFHTIIAPRALGPQKFWAVVTTLTRAYLVICAGILNIKLEGKNTAQLSSILEDPKTTYDRILLSIKKYNIESYYSIIHDLFNERKQKVDIISTNYTPIAEEIIGTENINKIAYIHGHIKLFESPYYLQVTDISKDYDKNKFTNEINFPFMFIQSGVKPIVERTQLEAFSKALNILDKSKVLFVVGYNFNCDDNHINSLLHNFLHAKDTNSKRVNKIVFFDYCDNENNRRNEKDRLTDLYDQLRIPENNRDDCSSKVHLIVIPINSTNALKIFKQTVEAYMIKQKNTHNTYTYNEALS